MILCLINENNMLVLFIVYIYMYFSVFELIIILKKKVLCIGLEIFFLKSEYLLVVIGKYFLLF